MSVQKSYPTGLLGRKLGMTQIFTAEGNAVPVTAIQIGPCHVLNVKTVEKDGYQAVQLGFEPAKPQRFTKAELGVFKNAEAGAFKHVKEVRCDIAGLGWGEVGKVLVAQDVFTEGNFVDICGTSLGKSFAGVFKRWGMRGQPSTRGTHEVRRHVGSIGNRKTPGRVFKNKKLPGHMGDERVTIQNLKVIGVRPEENVILVKGGVPGMTGGVVIVTKSIKKANKVESK